jgi:type VI secretion system protein VasD
MTAMLWTLLASLALAACAGPAPPPPPDPTIAMVTVNAAAYVNPNPQGQASPVLVRIYFLKSPTAFMEADFFQLLDSDEAVLAGDLSAREEFALAPSGSRSLTREIKDDGRFVGVLAAFREIDGSLWRVATEVPVEKTTQVTAQLAGTQISISAAPAQ